MSVVGALQERVHTLDNALGNGESEPMDTDGPEVSSGYSFSELLQNCQVKNEDFQPPIGPW